jgi:hypothetical protein
MGKHTPEPFIVDYNFSRQFCRICEMGTDDIPFETFQTFRLIGKAEYDPGQIVPENFVLIEAKTENLTWTDRFQFAYFHPIFPNYFKIFEYSRID